MPFSERDAAVAYAIEELKRAVAFQDQVRAADTAGENVAGTGAARDAREWIASAARAVVAASAGNAGVAVGRGEGQGPTDADDVALNPQERA